MSRIRKTREAVLVLAQPRVLIGVMTWLQPFEEAALDVDAVVFDALWGSGLDAGQVLEAGEGLVLTEVDDEVVGELHAAVG